MGDHRQHPLCNSPAMRREQSDLLGGAFHSLKLTVQADTGKLFDNIYHIILYGLITYQAIR